MLVEASHEVGFRDVAFSRRLGACVQRDMMIWNAARNLLA